MSVMSLSSLLEQPILSLSTGGMDQLQHVDINDLGNMWNVFNKCKNHLENGKRLEYMSWRLWQFQRRHEEEKKENQQQQIEKDNIDLTKQQQEPVPIKQYISTFLSSPAHNVHELAQTYQKQHNPSSISSSISSSSSITTTYSSLSHKQHQDMEYATAMNDNAIMNDNNNTKKQPLSYDTQKQYDSPHCNQITSATQSIRMITPPLEQQQQIIEDDDYEDEDDDDDYFLSDDDDYFYYHKENNDIDFENYFKKTQPRPPTPRRSLLSDLIQKQCIISSPTPKQQDLAQSLRDNRESDPPSSATWIESFHGW